MRYRYINLTITSHPVNFNEIQTHFLIILLTHKQTNQAKITSSLVAGNNNRYTG